MKKYAALLLVILAATIYPTSVFGASGDVDRSFGQNGAVLLSDLFPQIPVFLSTLQPDDKVVSVMPVGGSQINQFRVLRYLKNGTLDPSFGTGGIVLTAIGTGGSFASPTKIEFLPDGRLLLVGDLRKFCDCGNPLPFHAMIFAVRYLPNGDLDTSLGGTGIVISDIFPAPFMVTGGTSGEDMALQPDGKFLVAGYAYTGSQGLMLTRFNPNGSLDTTFDGDGYVIRNITRTPPSAQVALQADGKILVAGMGFGANPYLMERFTSTGALDTTFGSGGQVAFGAGVPTQEDELVNFKVLPDGKIVVAGKIVMNSPSSIQMLLARFNPNGSFDSTLDGDGIARLSLADYTDLISFIVQPDGKIVVGGWIVNTGQTLRVAFVARYRTNGALERQFGDHGVVRIPTRDEVMFVLRQSDGKLLVDTKAYNGGSGNDYKRTRLLFSGTRESDFDGDRKSDISVFRPSSGTWYMSNSTTGYSYTQFGLANDRLVPADYDGDGTTDVAVYRAGVWYLLRSSDHSFAYVVFGQGGDVPVPADYDGDGLADVAVFRQGVWYIWNSRDNSLRVEYFGTTGDQPVMGNFDGDGRSDLAVYRNGTWFVYGSTTGYSAVQFGLATDRPVAGDYDGDGKTDYAVYRDGTWHLLQSFAGFKAVQFGLPTDRPAPADYDGDSKTDIVVYRNGEWPILGSATGPNRAYFGQVGDLPVPSAFLPK